MANIDLLENKRDFWASVEYFSMSLASLSSLISFILPSRLPYPFSGIIIIVLIVSAISWLVFSISLVKYIVYDLKIVNCMEDDEEVD